MDKIHSRRAALGLAAGAALAGPDMVAALASGGRGGPVAYRQLQGERVPANGPPINSPKSVIPDDFWPWQAAMSNEAARMCQIIERRKEAILFSKSTSDAWKMATLRKLNEEQSAIRKRSCTLIDEVREWFFKGQGLLLK